MEDEINKLGFKIILYFSIGIYSILGVNYVNSVFFDVALASIGGLSSFHAGNLYRIQKNLQGGLK